MTGDRLLAEDLRGLTESADSAVRARLQFARDGDGRSYLAEQRTPYPFHICRPFYLAGDPAGMASVYVQSCAGGLFEHDRLNLELDVTEQAAAHVTTSASTIVHGMTIGHAAQKVRIVARANALIEYLPDPLILFPDARLQSQVDIHLADSACVILSDAFLLHDPSASARSFAWFKANVSVFDETGIARVTDRTWANGEAVLAQRAGVTGSFSAQGSFYVLGRNKDFVSGLDALRAQISGLEGCYAGASLLADGAGVIVRCLAHDGVALRSCLQQAWTAARKWLTGAVPAPRRK